MKRIYLNTLKPEDIIARLKKGEVLHNGSSQKIYYKDGFIIREYTDGLYAINERLDVGERTNWFFEEEEKFEITGTGLYRTRDGRKAFVSKVDKEGELCIVGIIDGDEDYSLWHKNGKTDPECDSDEDLFERIG